MTTKVSILLDVSTSQLPGLVSRQGPADLDIADAKCIIASRKARIALIGADMFGEPNFEMLLELFIARTGGYDLSITDVCNVSGAPMPTALRYLQKMIQAGQVIRQPDPGDARRALILLSDEMNEKIRNWLAETRNLARQARSTPD